MFHRLFALLSALSLLLCVAVVALWVRSYRTADLLTDWYHRPHGDHFIKCWPILHSERGGVSLNVRTYHIDKALPFPSPRWQTAPARAYPARPVSRGPPDPTYTRVVRDTDRRFWGFQLARYAERPVTWSVASDTYFRATTPHWAWVALLLVLPLLWMRRYVSAARRRRRKARGKCTCCGYDLRATPGRCPECGTSPSAKGAKA